MIIKVSILIPAYNAKKWINLTLESALKQITPNKEIIVVDDGSTDQTLEIARRCESKILKVIHQENQGASSARNTALSIAQGDYIQWLDADDLLAPDKIHQQLLEVEKGYGPLIPLSGSYADFYLHPEKAKFIPNSLWMDLDPVEWLSTKFRNNVWMSPAVWLVSRELTDLAGKWDERLSLDDDGEYFCRVVKSSERIHFVPEAKAYYRQWHSGSLSRTTSEKACKSLFLSLTSSIGYLRSLEDSERTREACLKLLQTWSHYFYPEQPDLFGRLGNLARELGGVLSPPRLATKYLLIEKLLGFTAAKKTRAIVANSKLFAAFRWEHLVSSICSANKISER